GGVIPEEYVVLYARDRTETVSQVWMGSTTGCCVCHDHKFDPFTMRDFYSMSAFFNNTTQGAMDGNIPNTPPVIPVPKPEDRARFEIVSKQLAEIRGKLEAHKKEARGEFDKWLAQAKPDATLGTVPTNGQVLHAKLDEGKGNDFQVQVGEKERTATLDSGFEWVEGRGTGKAFALRAGKSLEVPDAGHFEK